MKTAQAPDLPERFDPKSFSVTQGGVTLDLSSEPPIVRALIRREVRGDEVVTYNSTGSLDEWRAVMARTDQLLQVLEGEPRSSTRGCKSILRGRRRQPIVYSDDDELFARVVRNASGLGTIIRPRRVPRF